MNTRTQIIARKGNNTINAWACNHSTALVIARGYTDRGHDVTVVSYPELESLEITAGDVESMLGCNA